MSMRVFDTYYFNIAEKVSFAKTVPYLENMLDALKISRKNIAFQLYSVNDEPQIKALAKFPTLVKYAFSDKIGHWGLCSYQRGEKVHADMADESDIFGLFSKIPRTINFAFGHLVLEGINWFPDSSDTLVPDTDYDYPLSPEPPFLSNRITQFRNFDDGRKYNIVSVCIEVTDKERPRNSKTVIEGLMPYFGEPYLSRRKCVFSMEETERFRKIETEERGHLTALAEEKLPMPRSHKPWSDPQIVPAPDPKLPHVADRFTLEKAFKGTGFARQKGQPNWLSLYSCVDERGFVYNAYVQSSRTALPTISAYG